MGIFDRLLNTNIGRNIISVVLGLGIATLFRKVCNERNCMSFQGPIIRDIEGKIFLKDDKCYVFTKKHVSCSSGDDYARSLQQEQQDTTSIIDIAADNQLYSENQKILQSAATAPAPASAASSSGSWDLLGKWDSSSP